MKNLVKQAIESAKQLILNKKLIFVASTKNYLDVCIRNSDRKEIIMKKILSAFLLSLFCIASLSFAQIGVNVNKLSP